MKNGKSARTRQVEQAIANQRLDGLVVSEEAKRIADNYVVGKVSAQEAAQKIRDRFGIVRSASSGPGLRPTLVTWSTGTRSSATRTIEPHE